MFIFSCNSLPCIEYYLYRTRKVDSIIEENIFPTAGFYIGQMGNNIFLLS